MSVKILDKLVETGSIADASVTGAKLAADVLFPWRTLSQAEGHFIAGVTAGAYLLPAQGAVVASGSLLTVPVFHIDDADYAVAGRTAKLRVLASCATNAAAPTSTFAVQLVPVTLPIGGDGALTITPGAAVATATFTAPALSTLTRAVSSTVNVPADGFYALQVTTSVATTAANSLTHISANLQLSHA